MFTTVDQVMSLTGYEVTPGEVHTAQMIIEAYIGRGESEVNTSRDLSILAKATAYQAAYLKNAEHMAVFEQMDMKQVMQQGQMVTFPDHGLAPFLAPLAVITCKRLSWKGMRAIRTGSIYSEPPTPISTWRTA